MLKRRRSKQTMSLHQRIIRFAEDTREQAAQLPPGLEKDDLLEKVRQADTAASHVEDWARSSGLQPPK
jgi:hypothetical protein